MIDIPQIEVSQKKLINLKGSKPSIYNRFVILGQIVF